MKEVDGHWGIRKNEEEVIPKHGGYKNTKSWQLADLIYDVTVRFCDRFVERRSRTHDQMVQAARSGCQNLQEGSIDSATSKKIELKLTGTAKGSLEELRRDYQKFLAHRELPEWPADHPALTRFKACRCATIEEFRAWVAQEYARFKAERRNADRSAETQADKHRHTRTPRHVTASHQSASVPARERPCVSVWCCSDLSSRDFGAVCAANGALSLLNLCVYLVGRQMEAQAKTFAEEGGFTERLYRVRQARRRRT